MKPNKITLSSHPVVCHDDVKLTDGPAILTAHFMHNDQAIVFRFGCGAPLEAEHDITILLEVCIGSSQTSLYQVGFMTCHGPLSDKDSFTPLIRSMVSFFRDWGIQPELQHVEFAFAVDLKEHANFESRLVDRLTF